MPNKRVIHFHLVSDSTGETVQAVARSCIARFKDIEAIEHFWPLVRTESHILQLMESVEENPGIIMFTAASDDLRDMLKKHSVRVKIPCIPVLDPVLEGIGKYIGAKAGSAKPGIQHAMDEAYFDRIAAMDFALVHDDGQATENLENADVVLVGVSRTSKTPTCLYLANRGLKAANIPYVPGVPLPDILTKLEKPLIVGLTNDPKILVRIRQSRLTSLNDGNRKTAYTNLDAVEEEVQEARKFFTQHGWPVINVARRAIEETAASILKMYSDHIEENKE